MKWLIIVTIATVVPWSLWIYARVFLRAYSGRDANIVVTQYIKFDAAIALVVALYLLSPLLFVASDGHTAPRGLDTKAILLAYLCYYGTVLLLIFGSLVLRHIRVAGVFRFDGMAMPKAVWKGFVLLICATPLVWGAGLMANLLDPKQSKQELITLFEQSSSAVQRTPIVLGAVIAAPIAEELLFRGYLYGVAKRFLGSIPALAVTSMMFAVIHANLSSLLALFLFACCLTLAYETTGSLWASITMHVLFNAVNLLVAMSQSA